MARLSQVAELDGFYGSRVAAGDRGVWGAASSVGAAVWSGGELVVTAQSPGGLLGEVGFSEDRRSLLAAPYLLDLERREFAPLPMIAVAEGLGEEAERGFAVHASAWSPDLEYLAVYAEYRPPRELGRASSYAGPVKRLLLLEGQTRRVVRVLWEGGSWQSYRALALNGGRIAAATSAISIWDCAGSGLPVEPGGHEAAVRTLRFSSDGSLLASIAADGTVGLWAPTGGGTGQRRWAAHDADAFALDLHPGASVLATGALDGSLRLWSYAAERLAVDEVEGAVEGVAFSADGRELLVARGAPAERPLVYRVDL